MAQGGGWGNGGWGGQGGGPGQPPGGQGPGQPSGGGYGQPGGGYGQPGGGGAYGQPPGGGGGFGQPPGGGAPPPGGFGQPPGGGNYGFPPPPPAPPGGGGFGQGPGYGSAPGYGNPPPGAGYGAGPGGPTVAWEDRSRSFFSRWYATVRATSMEPRAFFSAAAASEDPMPPVMFSAVSGLMVGLVFGVFIAAMYVIMGAVGTLSAMSGGGRGAGGAGALIGMMTAMGIFAAFIYPIIFAFQGFVGPWVNGGIVHLSLALLGGAKRPYQSTVRVSAYAHGPLALVMIPCVGGLFAIICQIIALVVGLDETHKCGIGKAVLAVFLFPTICCVIYLVFAVAMGALGAMAN